ncbi:hypothetical protein RISK_003619 [Rhodopirellula islandica]|uniref:Uncharacterized protein n=1 Tax=Rhodopirellula islandica TaxID=595434 RepID=A0A0J1BDD6_RHOIS|nr:hypothetical protein RISK_003619 [Rhodopirellula islandica]
MVIFEKRSGEAYRIVLEAARATPRFLPGCPGFSAVVRVEMTAPSTTGLLIHSSSQPDA